MCLIKYHVLIFCLLVIDCYALNCRSEGGPKEAELKNIYKRCLKMQEGNSSTSNTNSEQDWRELRGRNEKSDWNTDRRSAREDKNERDERNSGRNDRINGRDDKNNSRDRIMNNSKYGGRGDTDRNDGRMDRHDGQGNKQIGGHNVRNGMEAHPDDEFGRDDYYNSRSFPQNDDYGGMSQYNNYYSSTQTPRRYKRSNRQENSGHRSQYNPNTRKNSGFEDNFRDEKNSSENNTSRERETDNKACSMHCFLENLEMIGGDGLPDRYLVAHAITKDVKNEDLRDFLQESIEECFQILDNENTEDKCDFSNNLLMCLSEKGRANCDDWKDDFKF